MTRSLAKTELDSLVQEADAAFWEVIVKRFPEAGTGDLSPLATIRLGQAQEEAVTEWIANNVPSSTA